MKTLFLNDDTINTAPCVATVGFFDGVHCGHRFLINNVIREARRSGIESMAITFDRHPRLVLPGEYKPQMLTTPYERQQLLAQTGVDLCAVLHFTPEMAALTAHEFIKEVLHGKLNVQTLITGYDNRFGRNREEGFDDYVEYGREAGIDVRRAEAFVLNGVNISSSVVRAFVSEGEVEMAAQCLGYGYRLAGHVVNGMHEGRKMGFPTANIDISDSHKMVPANGVYAVRATISGSGIAYCGMMNIGTRPTFEGTEVSLEVNLFDFCGDIYGSRIEVEFVGRIRSEHRFASVAQLRAQLGKDKEKALEMLHAQ